MSVGFQADVAQGQDPRPVGSPAVCHGARVVGLVSVIIPLYNCARYIAAALESVLAQTYPHVEIIVVDDASTDGSRGVVQHYAHRLHLITLPANQGLSAARNAGLVQARGEYIAFLDADDLWLPEKLALQITLLHQRPEVGLCAASHYIGDRQGRPLLRTLAPHSVTLADSVRQSSFSPGAVVVRSSALQRSGGFDETTRQVEDWDLWIRLLLTGTVYAGLPQPLWIYRRHGQNLSHSTARMAAGVMWVLEKYRAHPLLPAHLQSLVECEYPRRKVAHVVWLSAGGCGVELDAAVHAFSHISLPPPVVLRYIEESMPYAAVFCQDAALNGRWITRFAWLEPRALQQTLQRILPAITLPQCRRLQAVALLHCAVVAQQLGNRRMALRYAVQALRAQGWTAVQPGCRSFLIQALLGAHVHLLLVRARNALRAIPPDAVNPSA